jgi:hypothetical protein
MTLYGDYVSITISSGAGSGTVNVPDGARLVGLNIAYYDTALNSISKIGLTWTGGPTPLNFVPNEFMNSNTAGSGSTVANGFAVNLNHVVKGTNTITIALTSTHDVTVIVGLFWVAA